MVEIYPASTYRVVESLRKMIRHVSLAWYIMGTENEVPPDFRRSRKNDEHVGVAIM